MDMPPTSDEQCQPVDVLSTAHRAIERLSARGRHDPSRKVHDRARDPQRSDLLPMIAAKGTLYRAVKAVMRSSIKLLRPPQDASSGDRNWERSAADMTPGTGRRTANAVLPFIA
jgi:hypothetical protein